MKKMMLVLSVMISHSMSHGVGKVVQVLNRSDMPWRVRVDVYKTKNGGTLGDCKGNWDVAMTIDSKAIGKFPFEETERCDLNIGKVTVVISENPLWSSYNKDNFGYPLRSYHPEVIYNSKGKKAVKHFIIDTKIEMRDMSCPAPASSTTSANPTIEDITGIGVGGETVPCKKPLLFVSITPVTEKEFNTAVKDFEAKIKSKLKIKIHSK